MAFIETKGLFAANRLVCLPFTDCTQPLYRSRESLDSLMQAIKDELGSAYGTIVVRTDEPYFDVPKESTWVRHEMCTAGTMDEVASHFTGQARQNCRKAAAAGLEFRHSTESAAIDHFYRLHLKTRKKVGVPIQPKSFFRRLHKRIIENGLGTTALVSLAGRVLSASVLLHFNRTVMLKYFASDPQALSCRPNDFLTLHALKYACQNGFEVFDFGISKRKQDGLRRFKKKWGTREIDVHYDQIVGETMTAPVDESVALRVAGTAIRHSPEVLCRTLGKLFYRFGQ
jgi:hypothetical protein